MTGAGGVSDGAPDMEPAEPDDAAEEPPASECLDGLDEALEPTSRFEGETARAFSDNFTLRQPTPPCQPIRWRSISVRATASRPV